MLASKEGKAAKSRLKYDKYNKAQQEYLSQHKSGLAYGSGIALAVAKKKVKNSPSSSDRNPAGTTKSMLRCRYHHPKYCVVFGHRDARSKECFAHSLSAEERSKVVSEIFNEAIEIEVQKASTLRK